ncbi:MAG TPA: hypothetical protein VFE05_07490 [Longimicrobiaceae bacterium]|nr:hypothetical protein [Longimicrobiaceae bacterium]
MPHLPSQLRTLPRARGRRSAVRILLVIALPLLLPACRSPRADQACAFAPADTRGWTRVERTAATLLVPAGYRADSAAAPPDVTGAASASGEDFVTWAAGPEGEAGPESRIIFHVATSVAYADAPGGDTVPGLRDLRRCTLAVDGKTGHVSTSWMEDSLSPTGRTYQTIARWTGVKGGREMGIFIVAPTEKEQRRLSGVLASVHFR